jgi:hypothetical protein
MIVLALLLLQWGAMIVLTILDRGTDRWFLHRVGLFLGIVATGVTALFDLMVDY